MYEVSTYEMHIANEWLKTLSDPEKKRQMMLSFARVGVFNPRTVDDQIQEWRQWSQGKLTEMREHWHLHRWAVNDPIVLKRINLEIVQRDGHRRKNSYYYKSFTIKETVAPLQATSHAFGRYREREGEFVNPQMFWQELPPLISGLQDKKIRRRDIMLCTDEGAWLGEPLGCQDTECIHKYRKGRYSMQESKDLVRGFRAYTYIHYRDMMRFQRDIFNAQHDGNYELANSIQLDNMNENVCEEVEIAIVADNRTWR